MRRVASKRIILTLLAATLVIAVMAGSNLATTTAYFTDTETAAGNSLQAWSSSLWTQTSQADFEAGVANQVDTASSPGDVMLQAALQEPTTSLGSEESWYYASWSRRAPVTVANSGSGVTDYQVRIDVTYDADMQPDFDDIRFVDSGDATPLAYWRESYTASTSAVFWVNVPSIPSGSKIIYMYYGNGAASDAGDGDATFEFFDDFLGSSLDVGKWASWDVNVTVSGSVVTITNTGSWGGIISLTEYSLPYRFIGRAQKATTFGMGQVGLEKWYASTGDDTINVFDVWGGGRQQIYYTSKYDGADQWDEVGTWNLSTWYHYEIRGETDEVRYYRGGTLQNTEVDITSIPTGTMSVLLSSAAVNDQLLVDYCFISKYADPEPTTSVGSEDGWSRRAPVTINNPVAAQTDYQVRVDVTYDTDMRADFDDIRFFDSDGVTPLAHWRESYIASTSAIFWVKVPSIPSGNKIIYMYYGNNTASSASDGNATFIFFDDFSGDLSKWNIHVGTDIAIIPSYGNPAPCLEISGGITSSPYGFNVIGSDATYAGFQDGIIEADIYPATVALPEIIFRGNYPANTGYKGRWDCRTGTETPWMRPPYSGWSGFGTAVTRFAIANQWQKAKLVIMGSEFKIYSDGNLKSMVINTQYSGPGEIGLANHYGAYSRFDNVRVRKYATQTSYVSSGTIASQVWDTGVPGAGWDGLFWDETLMSNTDITFAVRASDTSFGAGDGTPFWSVVGGSSPVILGLPSGRYLQWRATLTTSDTSNTPTLHEVRIYHY